MVCSVFSDAVNNSGKVTYTVTKIEGAPAVLTLDQENDSIVYSSPFVVTGSITVPNGNTVTGVSSTVNSKTYSASPMDGLMGWPN